MSRHARVRIGAAVLSAALSCLGLLAAASQAGTPVLAGAAKPLEGAVPDAPFPPAGLRGGGPSARIASIPYEGGPVLHANRTHLIFWQPQGSGLTFDSGYVDLVTQFLGDVARDSHMTSNEYAITGQYGDGSGPAVYDSTYAGSVLDTDPLPPNGCSEPAQTGPGWSVCLTDAQLQEELEHVLAANRLGADGEDIYFLITPSGLGDCIDSSSSACALGGAASGYCGYHSSTPSGVLYVVIPYNAIADHCQSGNPRPNASTADPALSTISHEQIETITDPYGNAWVDQSGNEIADVCLRDYGAALGGSGDGQWDEVINGHHYWLQEIYSRLQGGCEPRASPDAVSLAGPGVATAGVPITFTGSGRQPGGRIAAYSWRFGDGASASGRVAKHVYAHVGTYDLRLRITDAAGNWALSTRTVSVTPAAVRDRSRRSR
ncbi:MAG: PKD domain-containing protein [Solirubrobacteraceae bacterium]